MELSCSRYLIFSIFVLPLATTESGSEQPELVDKFFCVRCKLPTRSEAPYFPTIREQDSREGISIGICDQDSAPTNVKCNKDRSNECISIKVLNSPTSCSKTLAKYFPKQLSGYELKGCWNSNLTLELESMMKECNGNYKKLTCKGSLCNKDPDPPVSHIESLI